MWYVLQKKILHMNSQAKRPKMCKSERERDGNHLLLLWTSGNWMGLRPLVLVPLYWSFKLTKCYVCQLLSCQLVNLEWIPRSQEVFPKKFSANNIFPGCFLRFTPCQRWKVKMNRLGITRDPVQQMRSSWWLLLDEGTSLDIVGNCWVSSDVLKKKISSLNPFSLLLIKGFDGTLGSSLCQRLGIFRNHNTQLIADVVRKTLTNL